MLDFIPLDALVFIAFVLIGAIFVCVWYDDEDMQL
tara:strand:+ start:437 stop:541 length:105 start_codon:yes stop_codon:yes gene_type:complete